MYKFLVKHGLSEMQYFNAVKMQALNRLLIALHCFFLMPNAILLAFLGL